MDPRRALYRLYWRMQAAIAPGVRYSQERYEEVLTPLIPVGGEWLDVGCGHQLLPPWRHQFEEALVTRCHRVVGVDYDFPALGRHRSIRHRARSLSAALPFANDSFDLVTANMVVEHLEDPVADLREIARVLKPGGELVFHTPHAFGYPTLAARLVPERLKKLLVHVLEGRRAEDVFPTHYHLNTRNAIAEAAGAAGLTVERLHMLVTTATLAMIPPLAVVELLLLRLLMTDAFAGWRTNIVARLRKPV